jgi:DNA processing protein
VRRRWAERGIAAVAMTDPRYPAKLQKIPDAPALLFLRGALTAVDVGGVAVIGTRAPSASGVEAACRIATALAGAGVTVLSGLAAGIDTAAHAAALAAGGRSVAVLGTGLERSYPAQNAPLQRRMTALVSAFSPESGPSRAAFPLRNALMSALSVATVIVEAGEHSGACIQARHALRQGRPVVLLPGVLATTWGRTLARQAGVRTVRNAGAVLGLVSAWVA